jgi:hypothetical protein
MSSNRPDSSLPRRSAEALRHEAERCLALASQTHDLSLAAELRAYTNELQGHRDRQFVLWR